jgi:hypothetical protein
MTLSLVEGSPSHHPPWRVFVASLRYGRLTISPASASMTLLIRRVADLDKACNRLVGKR